uniref:AT-rich interactive domain-containing protein 3 n=1 Tax=Varanus komodoensis TaxID=61221 RepID=A0A8D2Q7G3_VARKO
MSPAYPLRVSSSPAWLYPFCNEGPKTEHNTPVAGTLHLPTLNTILLSPAHFHSLSRSFCTRSLAKPSLALSPLQLYELDSDPKRKEFLDDLFGFMQKRGTPVNRIPIMAKQVLDLFTLYRLVTEKGGLVEVINKKIWREITKGLNLPTSITSAAFTLRTQYMKYLYPYECDKRGLSSPGELQAAIDSNRREGRRQAFGTALFSYSPVGTPVGVLSPPKITMPSLTISTHSCGQVGPVHTIKKGESPWPAGAASQAAALEQLREKLEAGEPPEKKMALVAEEQQRLVQHALQQNLLAVASQFPVNIKINSRGDDRQEAALNLSTNGISSINMSIEINGVCLPEAQTSRLNLWACTDCFAEGNLISTSRYSPCGPAWAPSLGGSLLEPSTPPLHAEAPVGPSSSADVASWGSELFPLICL